MLFVSRITAAKHPSRCRIWREIKIFVSEKNGHAFCKSFSWFLGPKEAWVHRLSKFSSP